MPDVAVPHLPQQKKLRKQLLDAPVEFLRLPADSTRKLEEMSFATVGEAFRAALAGRLSYRKKLAGKIFEGEVLEACCRLLGYQASVMQLLKSYRPRRQETVSDALTLLNGGPFLLPEVLLATSVREMFLPSVMHEALVYLRVDSVRQLLAASLTQIKKAGDLGSGALGNFLALVFDYLFIINEPENGLPVIPSAETDSRLAGIADLDMLLLLSPWFSKKTLREGAELLAKGKLRHPLFTRENCGGIIDDGPGCMVLLKFAHAPRLDQGFKIAAASCRLCDQGQGPSFCHHTAALAIHFLHLHPDGESGRFPLPLVFVGSPWHAIGQILFDLYGPCNHGDISGKAEGETWRLTMTNKAVQSWFSWLLKPETLLEGALLFPDKFKLPRSFPRQRTKRSPLADLAASLPDFAGDPDADDINQRPPHLEREESIWFWLTRNLFTAIPPSRLSIHRPAGEKLFVLSACDSATGDEVLNLILPRAKTPDVVDGLARCGAHAPASQSRAFSTVEFDEDAATLVITPCLELADGRTMPRAQLEENRYGRYYYLPEEGFISVQEQPDETALGNGFQEITRVPAHSVADFVRHHRRALLSLNNRVDPLFRSFSISEMPDRLELSACRLEEDWCYLEGSYGVGNDKISLAELLRKRQLGLTDLPGQGRWLKMKDSPLDWFYSLGEERLWLAAGKRREAVRLTRRELLMLATLSPELKVAIAQEEEKSALLRLLDVNCWSDQRDLPQIPSHLRDYQRHGLAWLHALYRHRLGGILADDMGLGKTHQALGLLKTIQNHERTDRRFLVICPATVIAHWLEKARQFYPELTPYVYHGSNRDLDRGADQILYLTTYGIIRRDVEKLAEIDFEVIIFDEIQHIKNKKTDVYAAAASLNGKVVVGLTGTPLENSVHDLKAIFDIVLPGFLGQDSTFQKQYVEPIEEHNDRQQRDLLARMLNPFLLRRTRQQVLTELPKVIEDVRTCRLSKDQVKLYRDMIASRGRLLLKRLADDHQGRPPYLEVLAIINYLKQICNHPGLVQGNSDWRCYESGKWDLFVDLLDQCLASSMKVVIFSHYTRMLDIIERYLAYNSISYCGLRGSMPLRKREENIRKFNTDDSCRVFCASLLAGGVGVDLTAAQAVIHYDRWWNAAREDQATARVHRMGQKNVVHTFKLVTVGTLEEKINSLIEKKRDLSLNLVREDDVAIVKRLSREDLIELLEWSQPIPELPPPAADLSILPTGLADSG
jgi:superfamily II DNA or RNA helicase